MPTKDGWPEPSDFDTREAFTEAHQAEQTRRNKQTFWAAVKPNCCWSCGFAGYRPPDTHELPIVLDPDMRQTGILPDGMDLWCFQEQTHLPREVDQAENGIQYHNLFRPKRAAAVEEILNKDRPRCVELDKWYGYREGLTIKEHYNEWLTMELEELRAQQTRLYNDGLALIGKGLDALTTIQAEHTTIMGRMEKSDNTNTTWFKWAAVVAIVLSVASIVTATVPPLINTFADDTPGIVVVITPTATRVPPTPTPVPPSTPATIRTP